MTVKTTILASHFLEAGWCDRWWVLSLLQLFEEKEVLCGAVLPGPLPCMGYITVLIKELTNVNLWELAPSSVLASKYVSNLQIAPEVWTVSMVEPWYCYLKICCKQIIARYEFHAHFTIIPVVEGSVQRYSSIVWCILLLLFGCILCLCRVSTPVLEPLQVNLLIKNVFL